MSQPLFTRAPEDYKRDINVLPHAVMDAAFYLHKQTGMDILECKQYVIDQIKPGGDLEIRDPKILCLSKEKAGERTQLIMPFTHYLKDVVATGNLISPTMAVYTNPKVKRSVLSDYIAVNIKKRAAAKKAMFVAKNEGNTVLSIFKDLEQTCAKLDNNGISGAHASPSTILFNKSSHSTLTSTCRSATSYGNANNEKFIAGKRHYWCADVVVSNLIVSARHCDRQLMQETMDTFKLHVPTPDEVMECITYSTRQYWKDPVRVAEIATFVNTMDDVERCAFVYIGDLFHLAKHNKILVRNILGSLATKGNVVPIDPVAEIRAMDADMKALISLLCRQELAGRDLDKTAKESPEAFAKIAATAFHCRTTLEQYRPLIKALWVSDVIPASIACITSVVRDSVLTSDTDSTIFTVQYWTEWYTGKLGFDDLSCDIAHVVAYLTSQSIAHILAQMSANMGIPTESIHRLAMKNEYAFPLFTLTDRAKHYFAYQAAREGNVYEEMELEAKGVALRNSNVPVAVMDRFKALLHEVMDRVIADGQLPLHWILDQVLEQEELIFNSVRGGRTDYMKTGQIKPKETYKSPTNATYLQYEMWEEVFADKYGHTVAPPYGTVKMSLDLNNRTETKNWIDSFKDQAIAERLRQWMVKHQKDQLTNFLVPAMIVKEKGVPEEIVSGINLRKLAFETLEAYYLLLGSLGIYMINKNLTVLISDYHRKSAPLEMVA
jgi:hypothetical protein